MSRSFNGTTQFASVTAGSAPIPGYPFTLMAWFKLNAVVTADMMILSLNTDPSFAGLFGLICTSVDGKFSSIINDQGGNVYATKAAGAALAANTWYCGLFTAQAGQPRTTYLGSPSGVASATDSTASTPGTNKTTIYIGQFTAGNDMFNGVIGEIACWNDVLSA